MRIAVVGAGAAGLMSAATAAKTADVVLYEKNEKVGKKIYITGKGRCNVTNMCEPPEFLENVVNGKKFMYGAIYAFPPRKTVEFLENNGVETKVERGNRVFPQSDKSSDVIKALKRAIDREGVCVCFEKVLKIRREDDCFVVVTDISAEKFDRVILACGGVSYPATGSTGDGYAFAKSFGHKIVPPRAALVPILLKDNVCSLEGLSLKNVNATISVSGKSFSEFGEMLFTSKGVSGPIILSLSSQINKFDLKGAKLSIDLKPALSREKLDLRILSDFDKYKNKQYKNALGDLLPAKLINYFVRYTKIDENKPVNSITRKERETIGESMKSLNFTVSSLDKTELGIVTAGGVDLSEVNPKTMESKLVPGIYFAGEMLDVDALTGGFNLQIAFATGYVAGMHAGELL